MKRSNINALGESMTRVLRTEEGKSLFALLHSFLLYFFIDLHTFLPFVVYFWVFLPP